MLDVEPSIGIVMIVVQVRGWYDIVVVRVVVVNIIPMVSRVVLVLLLPRGIVDLQGVAVFVVPGLVARVIVDNCDMIVVVMAIVVRVVGFIVFPLQ
jgi:hypothetical protein